MLTPRIMLAVVGLVPGFVWPPSTAISPPHTRLSHAAHAAALQDTLESLEKKSWVAWKARDGNYFEHFLSDDHVEVGFYGSGDKKAVVQFVASPACVVSRYDVSGFKLTVLTDRTAVLTYHAAQDTRCNGAAVPSPVWVTSTYVLRSGAWQNAVYQQSPDMRKAAK